ncbi:hypothetical protein ACQQ2T_08790 [Paraclostridium tenue]
MKQISYKQWNSLNKQKRLLEIKKVMNFWKMRGIKLRCDENWFYEALEAGYVGVIDSTLSEAMSILAIPGNAIVDEVRDAEIQELLSKVTSEEFKIYKYCQSKLDEANKTKEILSNDEFDQIITSAANELGIDYEEAYSAWRKVDGARLGIEC